MTKRNAKLLAGSAVIGTGIIFAGIANQADNNGPFQVKPAKPAEIKLQSIEIKIRNHFTGKVIPSEIIGNHLYGEGEDNGIVSEFHPGNSYSGGYFILDGKRTFIYENGVYAEVDKETGNELPNITEESDKWNCKTMGNHQCGNLQKQAGIPNECLVRDSRVKVRYLGKGECEFTYPPGVNEYYPNGTKAVYRITGNQDEPLIRIK